MQPFGLSPSLWDSAISGNPLAWPMTTMVRFSGFVLDDAVGGYVAGVGLDLLAAWLLVWATVALWGLPWRLSLASALFGGLHLFGGWQREPQELVFSATVLLWVLGFGAHARAVAVARARQRLLLRSFSWVEYWQGSWWAFCGRSPLRRWRCSPFWRFWRSKGCLSGWRWGGNPSRSGAQRSSRPELHSSPAGATRPTQGLDRNPGPKTPP